MELKDLSSSIAIGIRRNAAFETLGFLSDPQPGMLVFLEEERHLKMLLRIAGIAAVITTEALAKKLNSTPGLAIAVEPRKVFFEIHNRLARETQFYWSDFPTRIDASASIH